MHNYNQEIMNLMNLSFTLALPNRTCKCCSGYKNEEGGFIWSIKQVNTIIKDETV